MKVTNIEWVVSDEEIMDRLDNMTAEQAAEKLGIPYNTYANMTTEERHDYAFDAFRHNRADRAEFVGLSDEVELPEGAETWENDEITDYLCEEYGYYTNGYNLPEREGEER